ncbi:MAG: NAD(P) transhydrogenase subunit alpha [Saprospiraceae bacterium]|nr:NAD(P) transhydrogenase subunit alpha [Saprospiraceae bacterium]
MTDTIIQFFNDNFLLVYLLVFTILLGYEVVSKSPDSLYAPLVSGVNAISGLVLVGGILLLRQTRTDDYLSLALGFLAVAMGTANAVGGFLATDRMQRPFNRKKANQ